MIKHINQINNMFSMSQFYLAKDDQLKHDASRIMFDAARKTWKFRKNLLGYIDSSQNVLSGFRYSDFSNTDDFIFGMNSDGVGTKMDVAERLKKYDTLGFDLVAMLVDDAVSHGAEPLFMNNVLACNKIDLSIVRQLAKGLLAASENSGISVFNGEIEYLGDRLKGYADYVYNWTGTLCWAVNKDKIIDGSNILPGQSVVSLGEFGFRSNGFTLVRKILAENYGKDWHENFKYCEQVLQPSKIYAKAVLDMMGKYDYDTSILVTGIAHITGGGIPLKLGRTLKASGYGAELSDLLEPPKIMTMLQEKGKITDEEAYNTWNMGNGMLIITEQPEEAVKMAKRNNVDARIVGKVIRPSKIVLTSKGMSKGKKISFTI